MPIEQTAAEMLAELEGGRLCPCGCGVRAPGTHKSPPIPKGSEPSEDEEYYCPCGCGEEIDPDRLHCKYCNDCVSNGTQDDIRYVEKMETIRYSIVDSSGDAYDYEDEESDYVDSWWCCNHCGEKMRSCPPTEGEVFL